MGWRFRQSFTVIPGLKLNLSSRGLSASIGGAPLTMNIGPDGVTETLSVPGTGLSYRHHISHPRTDVPLTPSFPGDVLLHSQLRQTPYVNPTPIEHIHSASTELLTSQTLTRLKHLIQTAFHQHEEISRKLETAQREESEASAKYASWDSGSLLKRLLPKAFAKRRTDAEIAAAKVAELSEQLRLSTIATYIEIDKQQSELFYRLRDEFAALCECAAIWDVKSHQATDKLHERTTASTKVDRERVKFYLGTCDLIQWDEKVPCLRNAKGGEFFLYPGFILYRAAREAFSVIEYHDLNGKASILSFHEDEKVPSDSQVIAHTWAKCNKDGSRDKRFANNYQIPIAQYGLVTLKSANGLWEEFHFSNPQRLLSFLQALMDFSSSFEAVAN